MGHKSSASGSCPHRSEPLAWAIAHDVADGIGLKISKASGLAPGRRSAISPVPPG